MSHRGIAITSAWVALASALAACPGSTSTSTSTPVAEPSSPASGDEPAATTDEPAAAAGEREVHTQFSIEQGVLATPSSIVFDDDTATVNVAGSEDTLWTAYDFLVARPDVTLLRIEGHTSPRHDGDEGVRLATARAQAVARWLVAQGIDCKRVLPVGFGTFKPKFEDANLNQRIELHVATLRGRAIGGMPTDGGALLAADACE